MLTRVESEIRVYKTLAAPLEYAGNNVVVPLDAGCFNTGEHGVRRVIEDITFGSFGVYLSIQIGARPHSSQTSSSVTIGTLCFLAPGAGASPKAVDNTVGTSIQRTPCCEAGAGCGDHLSGQNMQRIADNCQSYGNRYVECALNQYCNLGSSVMPLKKDSRGRERSRHPNQSAQNPSKSVVGQDRRNDLKPGLVPSEIGSVPDSPEDFSDYYDTALEIVRRVRYRSHLSDDEIIVLAMVAAQMSLARYIEPHRALDADDTLNAILDILDRGEVVQAVSSKMLWLLNNRPRARLDAPSGKMLDEFDSLADPDEPPSD